MLLLLLFSCWNSHRNNNKLYVKLLQIFMVKLFKLNCLEKFVRCTKLLQSDGFYFYSPIFRTWLIKKWTNNVVASYFLSITERYPIFFATSCTQRIPVSVLKRVQYTIHQRKDEKKCLIIDGITMYVIQFDMLAQAKLNLI